MPARRTVLAVDGNALGHRAYRSAQVELEAGDRRPLVTGAVVSMLATAWVHGPYDAVLVGETLVTSGDPAATIADLIG